MAPSAAFPVISGPGDDAQKDRRDPATVFCLCKSDPGYARFVSGIDDRLCNDGSYALI